MDNPPVRFGNNLQGTGHQRSKFNPAAHCPLPCTFATDLPKEMRKHLDNHALVSNYFRYNKNTRADDFPPFSSSAIPDILNILYPAYTPYGEPPLTGPSNVEEFSDSDLAFILENAHSQIELC